MNKEITNIVSDEIFNTYESIRNFLLGDQKKLEELAKIEGREEIKDAISGATTSVAKCLLDVLSFGLASSLLEATSGVVESIKGNSNETERLLSAYDKIAKQYNKQNKAEIKKGDKIKLQTSDEMLNDIYKDSGLTRKQFRLLKNSMTRNFMQISLMKYNLELKKCYERVEAVEKRLDDYIQQQNDKKITQTPQKEDKGVQVEVLSDKFKGLEKLELSETNDVKDEQVQTPHATGTSNEKVQIQQQKDKKAKIRQFHDLPNELKNVVRLKLPKTNDILKEEDIQMPLKSQSLDSGIAYLKDKNKRVKSANKEMDGRKSELSGASILIN